MEKSYAHRSLLQKLGLVSGMKALLIHTPNNYQELLGELPKNVVMNFISFEEVSSKKDVYDFIHVFVPSQDILQEAFPLLKKLLDKSGMCWVSWPKTYGDIRSDLNDNIVTHIGLNAGLVDVKIASVSDSWSAIKFVYRLKDR